MPKSRSRLLAGSLSLAVLAGCRTTAPANGSAVKDDAPAPASPAADIPSIHGKTLPLGANAGVVMNITVSAVGAYDSTSGDAFVMAIRSRNAALSAASKTPVFLAVAIDAHQILIQRIASLKIDSLDRSAVNQAASEMNLDLDTVRSHVLLFFNDSSQALKGIYGRPDLNLSVSVVDAKGATVGTYALPDGQDAALAALDAAAGAAP